MSEPTSHVIYEFGEFRLDATRRLLYAKGRADALPVKPRVLEAILYFVERPGELLEKDRLLADLWPKLVVEESNLTQLISVLRRVLGESRGENRYLATVPGRGYRFVADVVRAPATLQLDHPEPFLAPPIEPESRRRTLLALLVLAVLLLGAAIYGYGRYAGPRPAAPATEPARATTELPARTVAILPFENLSPEESDEHLAFGIAESVLHRLASVRGLTLIARTSSFAFRGRSVDAREIGRTLDARYLVEGSLQRSGEQLRVTAQLIDASTGAHVWSLRFENKVEEIFAVEDQIAQRVAEALQVSLNETEHPYARFGIEAYLAFLDGRALVASRKVTDAGRAIDRFARAIAIEPEFAAAHAALANARIHLALLERGSPEGASFAYVGQEADHLAAAVAEAEPHLATALELDPQLGEAYVLRADLAAIAGNDDAAEAGYRKGLALNPSYGVGHEHFAILLWPGRFKEAEAEIDKAILVDPLNPRNVYTKGFMYLLSEQTGTIGEQSEQYFRKALQLAPEYHPALARIGAIRWHQGRFAEAIEMAEQAVTSDPRAAWARALLVEFYLELGEVDAARSVLSDQPDPAQSIQWLAICLYEQRLERAADLLRADPLGRGFIDHDIEAYVLRDAAVARGDLAAGRRELMAVPSPAPPAESDPFRMVTLSQVNLALGDQEASARLARRVAAFENYRLAYPRAAALTLLGESGAALDLLEDSFARGYRKRWWYAFDRDPAFAALRSEPRFQSLAMQARAHAMQELERLQRMRERGEVPIRRAAGTRDPAEC
jgi:TolB-like protein/DNA-binding winged helix-turn-helix (wHTH) protein/Tfp pilus assembly protein PilF